MQAYIVQVLVWHGCPVAGRKEDTIGSVRDWSVPIECVPQRTDSPALQRWVSDRPEAEYCLARSILLITITIFGSSLLSALEVSPKPVIATFAFIDRTTTLLCVLLTVVLIVNRILRKRVPCNRLLDSVP